MQEVINNLKKVLNKNDIIVIASSGGPDSMCLTNILMDLRDELNLKIIVAHVNHNVRINSSKEKLFVEKYCQENNIVFEYQKIKQYHDKNFHADARAIRYQFFLNIMHEHNGKYLMTAHHANDLCETILMRIVRGSNLKGYAGIEISSNYKDVKVLRPLLSVSKKEILSYNEMNNITYVLDESNDSDKYTRNRYRHHIIPLLEKENPNIYKKINEFSQKLLETNSFINKYVDKIINNIYVNKEIDILLLKKEDLIIVKEILQRILNEIYGDNIYMIEDCHIEEIIALMNSNNANKVIDLPNGLLAKKRYNKLIFAKDNIVEDYHYELINSLETSKWKITIINKNDEKSNNVLRLNSEDIKLPLIIRNKIKGDIMSVKNLNGNKKVKDIFIDEKINIDDRNSYPIVTDSDNNILWIPGIKKSKFDKEKNEKYDIILKHERKEEENEE